MKPIRRVSGGARPLGLVCVLASVLSVLPTAAAASTGGPYALESQTIGAGKHGVSGSYETIATIQPVAGRTGTGGGVDSLSGFLREYYRNLVVRSLDATNSVLVRDGVQFGVPFDAPVQAVFNEPIIPGTLLTGTTVTLVYDRLGNKAERAVPVSLTGYDAGARSAVLAPVGGWEEGSIYRVDIGLRTMDQFGTPMFTSASRTFRTLVNFAQQNVIQPVGDSTSKLDIPEGSLKGTGFVVFQGGRTFVPEPAMAPVLQTATSRSTRNLGPQAIPQSIHELTLFNPAGQPVTANFAKPAVLHLGFLDENNDGLLDGVAAPARTQKLGLWTLDEEHSLWVKVPGSRVNLHDGLASADIPHFSLYAVIATADSDVSEAYAFPVPWRPNSGDPARYGTEAGGITFVNIPQTGTISIYTLSGLLVREEQMNGSFTWVWDGRTRSGEKVASGAYLWLAKSGNNTKTGKLVVIR